MTKTTPEASPLDDLRQEIDEIDAAMHDLLMRRAERVVALSAARGAQAGDALVATAMSPGREAALLRRIAARHSGPLDVAAALAIWRQIIGAKLHLQAPYTLAIVGGDGATGTLDLARGHFGTTPPVEFYETPSQALNACAGRPNMIAILPPPGPGEASGAWWRHLPSAPTPGPRVVARLPFFSGAGPANGAAAYAVATAEPEPSGDDCTLISVEEKADVSRTRLLGLLDAVGIAATVLDAWNGGGKTPDAFLISASGFIAHDDRRLAAFEDSAKDAIGWVKVIGAYPTPLASA